MNYIGGKYKLLPQILQFFPQKRVNTFVDMFAGGLDVSLNVDAEHIICNDINNYVIGIYQAMQAYEIDALLQQIQAVIMQYNLSKTNRDGYNALRDEYNKSQDPLLLFVLVCFGFNHQLRFNNNGKFNNPFGINRSAYNQNIEKNLIKLHRKLGTMNFTVNNFRELSLDFLQQGDFVYADPPYLISCGSYNDGKRGFEGWQAQDDLALFSLLDDLNKRHIHFALSNVTEHKGQRNLPLIEWSRKYNTHFLNADYTNSSYQTKRRENATREVLITNF